MVYRIPNKSKASQPISVGNLAHSYLPTIFALDLGTQTGWAVEYEALYSSPRSLSYYRNHGCKDFSAKRFQGGGMRYLLFKTWLDEMYKEFDGIDEIYFEEVRRHMGNTAAHVYGGFMATLTSWCEESKIPYQSVPVKTIKKHITGKGNANKQMVIDALKERGHQVEDDNEADALALLLYIKERK